MKKPTVALFFGSRSTEHDVSILTALSSVVKPLQLSDKYNVVLVYIAKDGQWYSDPRFADVKLYQSSEGLQNFLAKQKPLTLSVGQGLTLIKGQGLRREELKVDVAFPALHGMHGEDGELMGLFEMAGVPYAGCDVPSSVVAMDKVLAKQVVSANNIPTPAFVAFHKHEYEQSPKDWQQRITKNLKFPMFVKPAGLGSSIGISRVTNNQELANAIEVALHYDDKALVEEGVNNLIEVTLPVMGNEDLTAAYLEQPLVHSEDFFDFETKYMQGGKGKGGAKGNKSQGGAQGYSKIPADLPKDLYSKAEQTGLDVYNAIGCKGTARVDMLIDSKSKKVYFNEVNPLPGSLYAHNWRKKGVSNVQLVERLVELAQQRHEQRQKIETAFTTNYLQQF
jgi:D-alanine-D-alanine ligase